MSNSVIGKLTPLLYHRVDSLPLGLRAHVFCVVEIARSLARRHCLDEDRAALGALAHDVARAMPGKELLRQAARLGLPVGAVDQQVPVLLHGPVGAELLWQEDGLDDCSIYNAVRWHTTAHPLMDDLGKVVFLADKLDPQKIASYPYLDVIRSLAFEAPVSGRGAGLDRAVLEFLTRETVARMSRGELVHPLTIEARNHLIMSSDQSPVTGGQPLTTGR